MTTKTVNLKTQLTNRSLKSYLFNFFRKYKGKSQFISIITKLSADKGNILYSLSNKVTLNVTSLDEKIKYIALVTNQFNVYDEKYHDEIVDKVMISYIVSDRDEYRKYIRNLALSKKYELDIENGIQPINNIPLNTNYKGWGQIIPSGTDPGKYEIKTPSFDKNIDSITVKPVNYNSTDLMVYYKGNKEILLFNDTLTKTDKFKRSFNSGEIIYFDQNNPFFMFNDNIGKPKFELDNDGNPILVKDADGNLIKNRLDVIKPFKRPKLNQLPSREEMNMDINDQTDILRPKFDITTLDIETYLEDNVFNILSICFGKDNLQYQFYRGNYPNVEDLLKATFDKLFTRDFNKTHIYIHNGAKFDLIFLVKYLLSRTDISIYPIYKDGKFISLNIKYCVDKNGVYQYSLIIRDSMLLLLCSLSKLGKAFNVEIQKDIYPYSFPNKDNLNYIGPVPAYEFFDSKKVSAKEYIDYVNRFKDTDWSLKGETLKYCSRDCISLYQILIKFCNLIFDRFDVNVLKCPTLPSLAFRIFRTKFLPKNLEIPLLSRRVYNDLVQGYFGGHVDMYIPKGPIYPKSNEISVNKIKLRDIPKLIIQKGVDFIKTLFKTVKHYDINSLYPSVMLNFKYPTDIIGYFIGDISLIQDYNHLYKDNLGIYKVKVEAPKGIKHPLLPHKINNITVYGVGSWTGWYYSEELENASQKCGYTYQILEGYLFESADIFSGYVNRMYEMKANAEKTTPRYVMGKLLQNSLFGKFAMKRSLIHYEIIKPKNVDAFINKIGFHNFINKVDIGNKTIISYKLQFQNQLKINMAIGAAISANSRIFMSQFKNNPDFILYYSDTDSIFIAKPLPNHFVDSKKIGFFKLEHVLTKFVAFI